MAEKKDTKENLEKNPENKKKATYKKLSRLEEEIESYNNLILLKPDYAEAYHNRGIAFLPTWEAEKSNKEL